MEKKPIQKRETDQVSVTYDPNLCIHAGECVKHLRTVFNPKQRPWMQPDQASPEEVEATIAKCPSGALKFARKG